MCLVIWGKFLSLKISLGMIVHMKYLYCSPVDPGAHSSSSVNQIFGFLKGMCFFSETFRIMQPVQPFK